MEKELCPSGQCMINTAVNLHLNPYLLLGFELRVRWTGWDLNPRPFACEANIRTPELPALKMMFSNPDIKRHNAF